MPKYHGLPVIDVVRGATASSSPKIEDWIQEIQDQERTRTPIHRIPIHATKKDPRLDVLFYDWHPTPSVSDGRNASILTPQNISNCGLSLSSLLVRTNCKGNWKGQVLMA